MNYIWHTKSAGSLRYKVFATCMLLETQTTYAALLTQARPMMQLVQLSMLARLWCLELKNVAENLNL